MGVLSSFAVLVLALAQEQCFDFESLVESFIATRQLSRLGDVQGLLRDLGKLEMTDLP
jgi:hypothetical protein